MFASNASLPIAVLFPPVVIESKALSPTTVLPATEFAPLPTLKPLIVEEETIVVAVIA